jgi:hypothetical protein
MRFDRLAFVLTMINFVMLLFILTLILRPEIGPVVAPVLRAREIELVDEQGNRRAQLLIAPATTMPDGTVYPETVLFRMSDENGRPAVKIGASVDGAVMMLSGDSTQRDWYGIQLLGKENIVKITAKDGHQQIIKP